MLTVALQPHHSESYSLTCHPPFATPHPCHRSCALVGDQQGRALAQRLLAAGCQPYFQVLDRWLWEGVLDDPHSEFMVQEDKSVGKNDLTPDRQLAYWYHR